MKQKLRKNTAGIGIAILGMFLLGLMMTLSIIDLQADSINSGVYSTDDKPYGLTYGEWTENFWKWMIPIPQQDNPNLDSTGKKCMIKQTDPNVWYLV